MDRLVAKHPLYDRDSLIILGEHVTTESGTGCVHTAPGHGEDDFYVGKAYGLDVLCPVDDRGVMTAEAPGFEGLFYDTANKAITEALEAAGALEKLTFFTHSYPHDWRTKNQLFIVLLLNGLLQLRHLEMNYYKQFEIQNLLLHGERLVYLI